ncbi:MAG TPA: hypothetical protein VFU69_10650 [Ktedonobacterales bacterium]|nr:hypothetical protein [Ktedonobacterales bacterium]
MSAYPPDQRCPRCQYPLVPGAATCANCGLALTGAQGAFPGSYPVYPPTQQSSGGSYGTLPAADPYGGSASPGGAGSAGNQPPTIYGGSGTINSAPTIRGPLYPSGSGGSQPQQPAYSPPPPSYPSSQPQGGFGSAPAYSGPPTAYGSQPQGTFGSAPPYAGSQPQGTFGSTPYGGTQPQSNFPGSFPPLVSAPPGPQLQPPKKSNGLRIALIALAAIIVLGGIGTAAYLLTRPKPVITLASDYQVGSTPAGAAGTAFHISGQKFSSNSSITFLLDGKTAPDTQAIQSDGNGNFTTDLKVSKNWPMGTHTITASDASGYVTQTGFPVQVVCQGCAKTPGPNGAPSNSISFSLNITINSKDFGTIKEILIITGKSDSGGTVCQSRDDSQTALTQQGTLTFADGNQFDYIEISTNQCSGTYVGGHLEYIETTVTDEFDFSSSLRCPISPHKKQVLSGDFTSPTSISGTYSAEGFTLETCQEKQGSGPINVSADTGTFTGTLNQ